jgi:hypothetical protein
MKIKTRIERLEKGESFADGRISIAVLDRILNDTISEQELNRWMPLLECILGGGCSAPADDSHLDRVSESPRCTTGEPNQ